LTWPADRAPSTYAHDDAYRRSHGILLTVDSVVRRGAGSVPAAVADAFAPPAASIRNFLRYATRRRRGHSEGARPAADRGGLRRRSRGAKGERTNRRHGPDAHWEFS